MTSAELVIGPCDYVPLPPIPVHWKVLDIGPGAYPLRRADVYIDRDPERLAPMRMDGKKTALLDIAGGLKEIPDKAFDYVWCSHVLEHVFDPADCATTLSRIAKTGTIVMPSAIKESLFNFEEAEHKWLVLPNPMFGGPPIFVRHNDDYIANLKDQVVQKAMCFLLRTGTDHDCSAEQRLHSWFAEREVNLDVIYHWTGKLELIVIG